MPNIMAARAYLYIIIVINVQCSMFNVSPQTIDNIDYVTVVYTIYAQTEDKCTQAHRKKIQWNNEHNIFM